jgi:hypothetical protein
MRCSLNRRLIAIVPLLALPILFAQEPAPKKSPEAERAEYFRASYTKYEYMIPMRDGVRLFTSIYAPKDTSQKYPILLMRTPYTVSPYGEDNYRGLAANNEKFAKEGFIFASQDVRGTSKSEGEFVNMRPYLPVKHGPQGHRRNHRHLRHHRLAHQECPGQQRERRHLGYFVSWLLRGHGGHRRASRAEGRVPAGSHPRLGVRRELDCPSFSLVRGLPSATSCGPPWPSFGCLAGTMPRYDSPPPCIWVL